MLVVLLYIFFFFDKIYCLLMCLKTIRISGKLESTN